MSQSTFYNFGIPVENGSGGSGGSEEGFLEFLGKSSFECGLDFGIMR